MFETANLLEQPAGVCGLQERNYGTSGQLTEDVKNGRPRL